MDEKTKKEILISGVVLVILIGLLIYFVNEDFNKIIKILSKDSISEFTNNNQPKYIYLKRKNTMQRSEDAGIVYEPEPLEILTKEEELQQKAEAENALKKKRIKAIYSSRLVLSKFGTMEERRVCKKTLKQMEKKHKFTGPDGESIEKK